MMANGRDNLVGIDLGTTFSVISQLGPDGRAVTIPNSWGEPLTPSVIYLDGSNALVGKAAKDAAVADSTKAAAFVKREMGSAYYGRKVDGRRFRPETLSAIILRKLKQDAERRIGPISKAVVTVPAFFDDTRRKATEDAGRIAGLEVLDIINEPTAAALAYAMQTAQHGQDPRQLLDIPGGSMTAVVYDLGGGTFDVTVVRLMSKRFETVATDGQVRLGGKDWDDRIVDHLASEFRRQFGVDPLADPHRRIALGVTAERTKVLLSDLPKAPVEFSHGGFTLNAVLTRRQFEELSSDLLRLSREVTNVVVTRQAGLRWDQVDQVLLVGGSTRMPMVKNALRELTGREANASIDPDQVVAQGAAMHAGIVAAKADAGALEISDDLRAQLADVTELNVNSHSLGVGAWHKGKYINCQLIKRNTQLPAAASQIFGTHRAGTTSIPIQVLEGEAPEAKDNTLIGECKVEGLPSGLPKNAPIQVRLAYGANGRVSVMALDMTHGRFAQASIGRQDRLREDEIQDEIKFVAELNIP